jgi:hypothetical protein
VLSRTPPTQLINRISSDYVGAGSKPYLTPITKFKKPAPPPPTQLINRISSDYVGAGSKPYLTPITKFKKPAPPPQYN